MEVNNRSTLRDTDIRLGAMLLLTYSEKKWFSDTTDATVVLHMHKESSRLKFYNFTY